MQHSNDSPERRPRILLVEDHDLLRQLISTMLKKQATVETAVSAQQAVETAKASTFDALILDISLAGKKSGIDVLEELRQDPRYHTTPMIACTAIVAPGFERRLLDIGFDAYLAKPFEPAELQQLVEKLITNCRQTETMLC